MLNGLNHITIAVSDVSRSFDFYVNTLGFIPKARWSSGAYLCPGNLWLCLSADSVASQDDYTHYAFSIRTAWFSNQHAVMVVFILPVSSVNCSLP